MYWYDFNTDCKVQLYFNNSCISHVFASILHHFATIMCYCKKQQCRVESVCSTGLLEPFYDYKIIMYKLIKL